MKELIARDSDKCGKEEFDDESYDSYIEDDVVTSTPVKMKSRRSVSLLDISDIGSPLEKSKINISSDTIGSNSSLCKDSGYNHSESSLASEKFTGNERDDVPFGVELRAKYVRLLEDVKFKDVMIKALHQSNHSLRMRIAESESKISDLRLKSESHCKCCAFRNSTEDASFEASSLPEKKKSETHYSVIPLKNIESSVITSPPPPSRPVVPSPRQIETSFLPSEEAVIKVQQWQNKSYQEECQKRVSDQIPSVVPSPRLDPCKLYIRPIPEPLPNTLSYMDTTRALAETYRKRKDKTHELTRVQIIGDQSVSVSPIQFIQRQRIVTNKNNISNSDTSHVRHGHDKDIAHQIHKRHTLFGTLHVNRQKSAGLVECLNEANCMVEDLNYGLSKLPATLNGIKSIKLA